jgi:hypothetical protein
MPEIALYANSTATACNNVVYQMIATGTMTGTGTALMPVMYPQYATTAATGTCITFANYATGGIMYRTNADHITDSSTWAFASSSPRELDPIEQWELNEKMKTMEYNKQLAVFRSMRLLLSMLDESQIASLKRHGWFELMGADGHRYRLLYHRHGNVQRLSDTGAVTACWCGHFGESLPVADTLVGQKLMMEFDPALYLLKANPVHTSHIVNSRPFVNFADHVNVGQGEEPLPPVPSPKPEITAPLWEDPNPGWVEPELAAV